MKKERKHIIIITVLAWCFFLPSLARAANDTRILQSDANGIVLEFTPAYRAMSNFSINGKSFSRLDFEERINAVPYVPGSPELFMRSLTVMLKGKRGNTVEVLNADYEDISGVVLPPFADAAEGNEGPVYTYAIDPIAYGQNGFLPPALFSLDRIAETQGKILGELRFFPIQYNPRQKIVRKYNRIVIRISYGLAEIVKKRSGEMTRGLSVNDDVQSDAFFPQNLSQPLRNSVLVTGTWFQFAINEDGMYKLSGQALLDAGISSSTDPRTIKIFSNGGFETPMDVDAPYIDDLLQNAIYVVDGGTQGSLDAADYILFYGKGTRGWNYNPSTKSFWHYINHFSETNIYWLTYGGETAKTMSETPSLSVPSPYVPQTVLEKVFREDEKINLLSSGLEWLGQSFAVGDQITLVHPLFGLDATKPIRYKFHLGARSSALSTFSVYEHGSLIGSIGLSNTQVGSYFSRQLRDGILDRTVQPSFSEPQSQLRFTYSTGSSTGNGYLDWYEIFYRKNLAAQGDVFHFHSDDTTATVQYSASGFSIGTISVFDVTRFDSVIVISSPQISGDNCAFQVGLTGGSVREFCVVGASGFKTPGSLVRMQNQDLHGDTTSVENIIITHPQFLQAALRLKSHRERPGAEFLKTIVVTTDQVYNEFGGGLQTPVAIRNYLRYLYINKPLPPKYVTLFGDGDYDYKRIISTGQNWMPPWETSESYEPLLTYASDDDFVIFTSADRVSMGVGRLAARSLQEANTMADKIIEYETGPVKDPWKMLVTFVGDDGLAAPGEDNGFIHVRHAEDVARKLPPLFQKRKIYLFEYPTVISAGGRRKPSVNEAITSQINQGTVILNFSGHGNPRLWCHENVFVRETDFPNLHNKGRYFFLVAATCNFSQFDAINDQSGGELLLSMADAGAIGVLSATRVVFAFQNLLLNEAFFAQMFQVNSMGGVFPQRLGDVLYRTKQSRTTDNDRKYFLLGDAALVIGLPKRSATIDSVNGVSLTQTAQIKALERVSVNATVRDTVNGPIQPLNGQAQVVVYDADKTVQINDATAGTFTYRADGNILFRGDQSVNNGSIVANFVVPKDISYSNDFGRIVSYFSNATEDGAGYTTNVRVGGTDSTAASDTQGPGIQLYLDNRGFRSGDLVSTSPLLIADLTDVSGVNTSGAGIGHRLEAWIDGNAESIDLTNYYRSNKDTYQSGIAEYQLSPLSTGTHRVRLRAWDTYNNSSTEETVFDVGTSMGLQLSQVLNYPNPFSSSTIFTFTHNQVTGVDAEVKIFTVAGRLIQSIRTTNLNDQFVQIPWDGRDRDGDPIANGVYLYKVIAKTQDGKYTSEALGKLSVVK